MAAGVAICNGDWPLDTPPPSAIDPTALAAVLAEAWSIDATALIYVPKGVGSYHWRAASDGQADSFITVDDLDTKPWLGRERDSTFERLVGTYASAWTLHHDDGLSLVVPPIRAADGSIAVRFDERYSIAVFPYVEGTAGNWGQPIAADERAVLARELVRRHNAEHGRRAGVQPRPHSLPERAALMQAFDSLGRPWTGGAYSERARHALHDNAASVLVRLARFDGLAAHLDRADVARVVTHGEPHPGNLIETARGVALIDWDTVALDRPERDLWMLEDDDATVAASYRRLTGVALEREAMSAYRLLWALNDLAAYSLQLRGAHRRDADSTRALEAVRSILGGHEPSPYGMRRPNAIVGT